MDRLDQLAKKSPLEVIWHPFQLRPDTPEGGVALAKLYPPAFLQEAHARLEAATREAGLPFRPPVRIVNTHRAHEAAKFAQAHGQADAFHRAALRAYFGEGRDLSDPGVLADIGQALGLDPHAMTEALASGSYRAQVDAELAEAQQAGVTSVPTFVLPNGLAIAGAHPVAVFERLLEQAPET